MTGAAGLVLQGVRITRAGEPLFPALDLQVAPGTITTLMGPSGVGKSTLLAWIAGALPQGFQASGRVWLDGVDLAGVAAHRRRVGLLFQDDLLFPHLSVEGNLMFALPPAGTRAERRALCAAALAEAGLAGLGSRDPATLSGGQRARVALLRTLLAAPAAVLLDEPFAALDADLRAEFRALVRAHVAARRLPALLVTHDAADAHAAGGPVHLLATRG